MGLAMFHHLLQPVTPRFCSGVIPGSRFVARVGEYKSIDEEDMVLLYSQEVVGPYAPASPALSDMAW